MTIDERIKECNFYGKESRRLAKQAQNKRGYKRLIKTAETYEQTAEWLKELKKIKNKPKSKRKRYRHYKGGIYEVICEAAHHTESLECLVIYKNVKTGEIWARPDWMFYGYTEDGTKRFEEVSE